MVKCVLCRNTNNIGINKFRQQLIGGCEYIVKCPKTTKDIMKEMYYYAYSRKKTKFMQQEQDDYNEDVEEVSFIAVVVQNQIQKAKTRELFLHFALKNHWLVASQLLQ